MRLDGAMLFVKDLDRMTAFYRDVLGLQVVDDTRLENWVEFRGDGPRFSLHAIPSAIADGIRIDSPPQPREQSSAKLAFAVEDVDATLERIEQMGLPLLRRPWGNIEAVDPEGNVFALSAAREK
jgi:catechol 2,3-dioxygenase-like lactoylglutathione lyase family enzyme